MIISKHVLPIKKQALKYTYPVSLKYTHYTL